MSVQPSGITTGAALGGPTLTQGLLPANRISAAMLAAQGLKSRETGLSVTILDSRINQWEHVAGRTIPPHLYADYGFDPKDVQWQGYRGSAGMCKLNNGTLVRVRNGDEEAPNDRQIWYQEITDPTNADQWETWTVYDANDNFGVSIQANGNAYVIYHSRAAGIYRNGVLKWTPPSGAVIDFVPVRGRLGAGWVRVVSQDALDLDAVIDLYYTADLNSVTPAADENNYRWPTMEIAGIEASDGKVHRFYSENLYFPARDQTHGKTIWQQNQPDYTHSELTAPYPIRGIGGGSGLNFVKGQQVCKLSDNFYYLFMTESRITDILDNTPAWTKLWETTNVAHPTGVLFDPADSTHLQVVSRTAKRRYRILQSDQSVTDFSPVLTTYSIGGIAGDPSSSANYMIIETPWIDGNSAVSKVHRVRKSDDVILNTYNLPVGRWTDIQSSATHLYLTNLDTDKIHKYTSAMVAVRSFSIYYGGVRQVNPSGTAYFDGSLYYFFINTGRMLKATEAAPTKITDVISLHGTAIYGGEFDDTGTYLFADNYAKGKTYKFQLETTQVIPIPAGGTSLGDLTLWIRSKDLFHWSAPVVGPGIANPRPLAGLEESGSYVYWADNGSVYRRPTSSTSTDISNYVTTAELEMPRDNQNGQATLTIANPSGVNDSLLELADQEILIRPGIRNTLGAYEFVDFNRWWVKSIQRQMDGPVNRLQLKAVDIWDRITTALQDVYNIVGKTQWDDWDTDKKNEAFNYYFVTDTKPTVVGNGLRTHGDVLFTGWRGHNPDFQARFSSYTGSVSLLARYVDSSNFIRIKKYSNTISVYEVVAGTATIIDSFTISSVIPSYTPSTSDTLTLKAVFKWKQLKIYFNGTQVGTVDYNWKNTKPGYAGVGSGAPIYTMGLFSFTDWEYDVKLSDLIKTALSLGDVHDVVINGAEEKAYALIWGPQTDIPTAAEALRQFLVSLKLSLAYRGGVITLDKFNSTTPIFTLDNTIFESAQTEEPQERPNWVSVDGSENSWLEIDVSDSRKRGRQNVRYFDLPELLTLDAVKERAREEMRRAVEGQSPSGSIVMPFNLWRMDPITWIDNAGNSNDVRVEGISISIDQSKSPHQRMKVDTSLLADVINA